MNTQEYALMATERGAKCYSCEKILKVEEIRHHDDDNGWLVEGYRHRQWLFFLCSDCGYGTSFIKLRIEGSLCF